MLALLAAALPLGLINSGASLATIYYTGLSDSESGVIRLTGPNSISNSIRLSATQPSELKEARCSHSGAEYIGIENPAAVYCQEMGYEYKVVATKDGEKGVCVLPSGEGCDAWAFYRGECGTEFSYCAKMGWPVVAEGNSDPFATKCTTCVLPDGSHQTVRELLNLSETRTVGIGRGSNAGPDEIDVTGITARESGLPEYFDWRKKDDENWMTPVKDQAGCESCWAFSAVGIVEPLYNIFYDAPNLDLDLSEQYLVSDCCTYCGDCEGGWHGDALEFIRDEGITDEACFPYTATDCPCSDRCDDWSSRLKAIHETEYVQRDIQTIKEHLIEKGPLAVSMGIGAGSGGHFDNGIYRCTDDSWINHCVVIAGYDEKDDYWIVKNSWGTGYGDNGYFNVGFGECSIESYVYYALLYSWPALLSPANGLAIRPGEVSFYWGEQVEATGYHVQIDQVDTFNSPDLIEADPNVTEYTAILSIGSYYWRVKAHLNGEDSLYSPAWRLTVTDEPVIQVTTDPGSDYHPAITQTENGKVWAMWESDRSGNLDIWYKTSPDGGYTWSSAYQITTDPYSDSQPAITRTNDGKVWVVWESNRSGNLDIWYKTSPDGGYTWSIASQITTDPDSDSHPAITRTDDGKVWVTWESNRSGNYDIWCKTIPDGGTTWSSASQITTDPDSDSQPAITQTDDGKVWVVWESWRSGNLDIWYTTSSDGGTSWFSACRFTNFTGYDGSAAATALSSGEPAVAFWSDRAVNYDTWYGIVGLMEDIDPPPHLDWSEHEPRNPDTEQTVTVRAEATDEAGVESVQLVWYVDGTPQENLPMYDDGNHNDHDAGDGIYGVELGPFPTSGTEVDYQIQVSDIDENIIVAPQYPNSFQVIEPFIKTADILLVADNLGLYTSYYTDSLDNLGYEYDVWDTHLRENIDGETLNHYLRGVVIWATPDWGYISYAETQDSLASYLDNGGRLLISGQDIGRYIGSSAFYQDYLHAQHIQDDINLFGLFGVPGDPITDGLYISISGGGGANNQYRPSEIDPVSPAVAIFTYDASAATALVKPHTLEEERVRPGRDEMPPELKPVVTVGEDMCHSPLSARTDFNTETVISSGCGAIRVNTGTYRAIYFSFGFEAINSAADRALIMDRVMTWLSLPTTWVAIDDALGVPEGGTADVDIIIVTNDPDGIGSATIALSYDPSVVNVGNVSAGDLGNVTWNTVGSTTTMTATTGDSPGPTDTVLFSALTLNAVVFGSSVLDIEVSSLYDGTAGDPQPITPSPVIDGTFSIAPPTPTPTPISWEFPHGLNQNPSAVFSRHYDGTTIILADIPYEDMPEELIIVWFYDEDEMEWKWFRVGWPESTLETLEHCHIYDVIVMDACTWDIPQP